jgi:hypothetical protein
MGIRKSTRSPLKAMNKDIIDRAKDVLKQQSVVLDTGAKIVALNLLYVLAASRASSTALPAKLLDAIVVFWSDANSRLQCNKSFSVAGHAAWLESLFKIVALKSLSTASEITQVVDVLQSAKGKLMASEIFDTVEAQTAFKSLEESFVSQQEGAIAKVIKDLEGVNALCGSLGCPARFLLQE